MKQQVGQWDLVVSKQVITFQNTDIHRIKVSTVARAQVLPQYDFCHIFLHDWQLQHIHIHQDPAS